MLATRDLDPVYCLLADSDLGPAGLRRWCLAYWCFYSAATASRVLDAPDYWAAMREADRARWPRGPERRHFRGAASARAIGWLAARFPTPEAAVDSLAAPTARAVSARVRAWPQFGPWVAFKVADMLERVLAVPVDFSACDLALYAEPRAGAALVARLAGLPDDVPTVLAYLADRLGHPPAPPRGDRPVGPQELETVLCKFKAHHAGRYPVGKDSRDLARALDSALALSPTARRLRPLVPDPAAAPCG